MLNARADLGSRDLGAVNGVLPRVSLAEQAGPEESRNDQPEDQRYWSDMPGPHATPPVGNEHHPPLSPSPAEGAPDVGERCARVTLSRSRGAPRVKIWPSAAVSAVLPAGGAVGDHPASVWKSATRAGPSPVRMGIVLNARAGKVDDGRAR